MGIGANSQERKIRKEISNCPYDENIKDYLYNMITQIIDYPKKSSKAKYDTKIINRTKIIIVYYPMNISIQDKNYKVPLKIHIMQHLPYDPPQFYLEPEKGFIINKINTDIIPDKLRVITDKLKNWNPNSNIIELMDEVYTSFSNNFPLIKQDKKSNDKINVDLNKINSSYIFDTIISLLKEKKKLEIFKCSKKMQTKLNINLLNYQLFSGTYIVSEKNGKVREYIGKTDIFIYEGEYKNGKRNGKGKEFDEETGKIIYDGEFLDGKKHGKAKEYDCWLGTLSFDGDYTNGEKIGKGIRYYFNGLIQFEGEYSNGKIWNGVYYYLTNHNVAYEIKEGKGTIKYFDGDMRKIFEGEYPNGTGREYYSSGKLKFEGEYLNGIRNGKGKEYDTKGNVLFDGEYLKGKEWNGTFYPYGDTIKNGKGYVREIGFEGEYINGERNGKSTLYWDEEHIKYDLEYLNGKINGKVITYYSDGTLEKELEFLNGMKNGKGKEYYDNGVLEFEGEYLYNYRIKGKKYFDNGKLEFEGDFLFGKKWNGKGYDYNGNLIYELNKGNGKIKEYNDYGQLIFEGEYLDGKKHGLGKEYRNNGKLLFEGEYINGQRRKGKEYGDEWIGYKIRYDGEFLNGQPHGKVKAYDAASRLIDEGEYIGGELNGKGIKYFYNSSKIEYEGEFARGKKTVKEKNIMNQVR